MLDSLACLPSSRPVYYARCFGPRPMTQNTDPPLPPEDDEVETQPVLNGPGLAVGFRLKERYRIEGPLGRGAMGIVYLARDEQLAERTVVVKVLPEHHAGDERHLKKFH